MYNLGKNLELNKNKYDRKINNIDIGYQNAGIGQRRPKDIMDINEKKFKVIIQKDEIFMVIFNISIIYLSQNSMPPIYFNTNFNVIS